MCMPICIDVLRTTCAERDKLFAVQGNATSNIGSRRLATDTFHTRGAVAPVRRKILLRISGCPYEISRSIRASTCLGFCLRCLRHGANLTLSQQGAHVSNLVSQDTKRDCIQVRRDYLVGPVSSHAMVHALPTVIRPHVPGRVPISQCAGHRRAVGSCVWMINIACTLGGAALCQRFAAALSTVQCSMQPHR
jgi:hypothetical protein